MEGFRFVTKLFLEFKKIESDDETKYSTFYSSSKIEKITMRVILMMFLNSTIISNKQKFIGKGSAWIIDSVVDHIINISKYKPLSGSSYIKLPIELDRPKKGLNNIQNIYDNECFKWCLVRYLHPEDHNTVRIRKVDTNFT